MHLFKSREPNLVHYATAVTHNRVPVFRNDHACLLLIDAMATTRSKEPFKLIGYVVMPDHFHLLANPLDLDISIVVGRIKGRAAVAILSWLRSVTIEVDQRWLWTEEELSAAKDRRTSAHSKRKTK